MGAVWGAGCLIFYVGMRRQGCLSHSWQACLAQADGARCEPLGGNSSRQLGLGELKPVVLSAEERGVAMLEQHQELGRMLPAYSKLCWWENKHLPLSKSSPQIKQIHFKGMKIQLLCGIFPEDPNRNPCPHLWTTYLTLRRVTWYGKLLSQSIRSKQNKNCWTILFFLFCQETQDALSTIQKNLR